MPLFVMMASIQKYYKDNPQSFKTCCQSMLSSSIVKGWHEHQCGENRDRFSVLPTESTACKSSMYCLGKFDRNTERCTVCCAVGSAMLCSKAWTVCTARAPRPERPKSPKDWLFSDHFGLFRTISNDSWTQAAQPSRINATWPKEEICLHIFQIEGNR